MSYEDSIEENKKKTIAFIKKNKLKILFFLLLFTGIYIYFRSIYRRIPRYLSKLNDNLANIYIQPITSCPKLITNGYKLCDFYISSSAKTYLPCTQYYDYSSTKPIELAILNGARYIELDIYNKGFCQDTIPVVCNGRLRGNWHWTTELTLESCCEIIYNTAFSGMVPNPNDPFFLCINLYLGGNCQTSDKIADILKTYFRDKLLGREYSYQRTNIALVNISQFIDKIVILANNKCRGSSLEEIINYTWDQPFMRSYSHFEIQNLYEPTEVANYNKKNLTRVYPGFSKRKTDNYNPRSGWLYGCQFVAMNFTDMDENMKNHFMKFKRSSFVLKPYQLRYHATKYRKPRPQTKKVSFAPEQISTPFYSITF